MRLLLSILGCSIIVVAIMHIISFSQLNTEQKSTPQFQSNVEIKSKNSQKIILIPTSERKVDCLPENLSSQPVKSIQTKNDQISDQVEKAMINPINLIKNSESGDPEAKLALFNLVNNCFPRGQNYDFTQGLIQGNEGCPLIPSRYVENPIIILEEAAQQGSPYAKLIYAQYAQSRIARLREKSTNEAYQEAAKINKTAEKYGEDAAQAGLLEAWQFMARAYYTGAFGVRNSTLAYAHALPTVVNGGTQDDERLVEMLRSQLVPAQIKEAEKIAFNCSKTGR